MSTPDDAAGPGDINTPPRYKNLPAREITPGDLVVAFGELWDTGGQYGIVENVHFDADGATWQIDVSGSPICGKSAEGVRFVGTVDDTDLDPLWELGSDNDKGER